MTEAGASETRFDFHIAFQTVHQGCQRLRDLFLEGRDIALFRVAAPLCPMMRPAPPSPAPPPPLAGGELGPSQLRSCVLVDGPKGQLCMSAPVAL